jgi:hypothetical protein
MNTLREVDDRHHLAHRAALMPMSTRSNCGRACANSDEDAVTAGDCRPRTVEIVRLYFAIPEESAEAPAPVGQPMDHAAGSRLDGARGLRLGCGLYTKR